MARPRRDLVELDPSPLDAERDFRRLRSLLMASEPNTPAAGLSARILAEADAIGKRGGSPERRLAELWTFVDALGLHETAERRLAHLARREQP